jgi:hypothetical protein
MAGLDSVVLEDRDDILEMKLRIKNLKTQSANRSNRIDLRLAPIELRLDLVEA